MGFWDILFGNGVGATIGRADIEGELNARGYSGTPQMVFTTEPMPDIPYPVEVTPAAPTPSVIPDVPYPEEIPPGIVPAGIGPAEVPAAEAPKPLSLGILLTLGIVFLALAQRGKGKTP